MAENDGAPAQGGATTTQETPQEQQGQQRQERSGGRGSRGPQTTPGSHDQAVTADTNPTAEQVTQQGGKTVKAEGQRIRDKARKDAEERDAPVTLAQALNAENPGLKYDDSGGLVNKDGKKIAMAADATDADVGWTVQQAGAHLDEDERTYSTGGPATVPDQTVHLKELPDPLAAIQGGLLPQNVNGLNIDPAKFEGKKSLEP